MLYQKMCWATQLKSTSISGCLLLLQAWAWWRLPFLHPKVIDPYMFSLVTRSGVEELGWACEGRTTPTSRYGTGSTSRHGMQSITVREYFS
ncbi:hypothetical protein J1N35_035164 [Gossypium stocksii]|uniref:Aminotransferase-like plant mobile domain-containing protein n=1 Tax=Gossypium stocksii TaxID=47602 RepID=A0A9D3ZQP7_9ROSI|nr:hypothetical protein J1N35_035164 [Gossypium stocksii]